MNTASLVTDSVILMEDISCYITVTRTNSPRIMRVFSGPSGPALAQPVFHILERDPVNGAP
ncbi:MAG: hypothetical protein Kow0074_14700 [Candidatus Zixiibacteriota bacterium]